MWFIVNKMTTISASDLVSEFKRSGKFDELRRYLLEEFSQSPQGQQLFTSLNRLAQESEATSKPALIAALSKSALFNGRNGVVGVTLLHSQSFKDQVRTQLRYSYADLKEGKKTSLLSSDFPPASASSAPAPAPAPTVVLTEDAQLVESKDTEDDAMDVDEIEETEGAEDNVSIDLQKQARDVMNELNEINRGLLDNEDISIENQKAPEELPQISEFYLGQKVACQVGNAYYLCKILKAPSESEEERMYELSNVCQYINVDIDGKAVEENVENTIIRSSKLVNIMDEALFDEIQLGDHAYAIYREDGEDDESLVNNEFYPCEVVGMAKNGLFVKYADNDRHIVKLGEMFKL